ncbi:hypothetical protein PVAP13_6NG244400 [Panicum virgatum]|uniref:Uncharacterized protein n=1 Tax=Panicum virgatum TaxID=38727 RepID=A0A8T0R261_PANVG|nr:hypothetical protein PVAP13_6NG244400 [Panicum virgatum]
MYNGNNYLVYKWFILITDGGSYRRLTRGRIRLVARARSTSLATAVRVQWQFSDNGPDPLLPMPIFAGKCAHEIPTAANSAAIDGCSEAMGSEQQAAGTARELVAASMARERKELAARVRVESSGQQRRRRWATRLWRLRRRRMGGRRQRREARSLRLRRRQRMGSSILNHCQA